MERIVVPRGVISVNFAFTPRNVFFSDSARAETRSHYSAEEEDGKEKEEAVNLRLATPQMKKNTKKKHCHTSVSAHCQ